MSQSVASQATAATVGTVGTAKAPNGRPRFPLVMICGTCSAPVVARGGFVQTPCECVICHPCARAHFPRDRVRACPLCKKGFQNFAHNIRIKGPPPKQFHANDRVGRYYAGMVTRQDFSYEGMAGRLLSNLEQVKFETRFIFNRLIRDNKSRSRANMICNQKLKKVINVKDQEIVRLQKDLDRTRVELAESKKLNAMFRDRLNSEQHQLTPRHHDNHQQHRASHHRQQQLSSMQHGYHDDHDNRTYGEPESIHGDFNLDDTASTGHMSATSRGSYDTSGHHINKRRRPAELMHRRASPGGMVTVSDGSGGSSYRGGVTYSTADFSDRQPTPRPIHESQQQQQRYHHRGVY